MSRMRLVPAVALTLLLVAALLVLIASTPAGAQVVADLSTLLATPIPLAGMEVMDYSPLPTPAPRAIYIANDPLQSPLVTPMP